MKTLEVSQLFWAWLPEWLWSSDQSGSAREGLTPAWQSWQWLKRVPSSVGAAHRLLDEQLCRDPGKAGKLVDLQQCPCLSDRREKVTVHLNRKESKGCPGGSVD